MGFSAYVDVVCITDKARSGRGYDGNVSTFYLKC